MIKHITAFVVTIALLTGCEDGSYLTTEQSYSDAVTRIEASGDDMRIYEFTPKTAKHKQCVFVAASRRSGLQCFDKLTEEK